MSTSPSAPSASEAVGTLIAEPGGACVEAMNQVRTALDAYLVAPEGADSPANLRVALQELAGALISAADQDVVGAAEQRLRELLQAVSGSGLHDWAVAPEDLAVARQWQRHGQRGLLAALLLVPAWQWPDAPALAKIPEALVGDYVAWFLAPPQAYASLGDAALYPRRYLTRLEDLLQFALAKAGTPVARVALVTYLQRNNCIPLYFCSESLKRHYEVRARLLSCAVARPDVEMTPKPRAGRRLRVGIINRHFAPQTETYTTLPTFEQLDPERFEVLLFACQSSGTPLEDYARTHAASVTQLPSEAGAQVDLLRAANLDVAVFGTNVTAVFHEITRLALHRVAPLQVVNNSSCTTTGMPEIDLYVSGTLTEAPEAPAHFSERLGLVAGPAHAFNYEADRQEPTSAWTRELLGLPQDAVVFVTAANFFKVIPEMQHAWAKLLAAVPGSRLLVHPFNPNWSSAYPVKRFSAEFDRVLEAHGVATDRVVISSIKFPSRTDVKELLRVGDLYLDTYPFGGVNSLVDPLELGIPPIVWEGETFRARMGGALLRSLGLDELIATDEAGYLALATKLATDGEARAALKKRIEDGMSRAPVFLDPLAASEAFGALLETAYDELVATGRAAFRANRTPIRVPVPADPMARVHAGVACLEAGDVAGAETAAREVLGALPDMPAARQLIAACLLRRGAAVRAVDYYLGAVQRVDGDAPLWLDLAFALRESGRTEQALQALETSLRLDSKNVDAWQMLAELADSLGNQGLAAEARKVARQLAPADQRMAGDPQEPAVPGRLSAGWDGAGFGSLRPKHVMLYTDDPEFGGVAQWSHNILLALTRAGYRVTCTQSRSESPLVAEQREAGVKHEWLAYDTGREFARTLEDWAPAAEVFRRDRPDLVIFADCCPVSNFAARGAAFELGIPYVTVVHFVGEYLAKNFAAYLPKLAIQHAGAREVVAVSQNNLDLLHQLFRTPPTKGRVIHNGRPPRFFTPTDQAVRRRLRAEQGIPDDAVVCFTAARLTGVKGFAYQLDAIRLLKQDSRCNPLHFVWAGDGDLREPITRRLAELGVSDRVHLLGHRWDVADWYDAADIFVLPSEIEGMPLSVMEAMAKGLPVVATAVSGTPEEMGDTGQLLPNPAGGAAPVVRELAQTLARWAEQPTLRREVGRRGRERAETMFREALMIERVLALVKAQVGAAIDW